MNFAMIISILMTSFLSTYGQSTIDTIVTKKGFGGYVYFKNKKNVSKYQLVNVMRSNAKAYKQINSALPNDYLAKIFSYAGGGLIGWPIGAALSGGKPNWSLAGIGAGLIVVAIPIGKQCDKKINNAIRIFNDGIKATSF